MPRYFQGNKLRGICTLCQEILGFRMEWESEPQKKNECWFLHLGFKHRMILNHMPDEIYEEFNDILRTDEKKRDLGLEIPCLACPEDSKTFMCTSNYLSHLTQKHYLQRILSKHNPGLKNCPVCKMNIPDQDNRQTWFARHLAITHGLIYEYADKEVANQLQKLGFVPN